MTGRTVLLAFILGAAQAAAGDLTSWGQSGDWSVLVDPEAGNGCLIQKDFDEGVRIRFGYLPEREGGFFSALSRDWTDIEPGTSGTVKFLTDQAKFAGDVEMIAEGDWRGGFAFFNNPNLTGEMARRRSITVIGPRGGTFEVDLTGSARAITMMDECQAAQG